MQLKLAGMGWGARIILDGGWAGWKNFNFIIIVDYWIHFILRLLLIENTRRSQIQNLHLVMFGWSLGDESVNDESESDQPESDQLWDTQAIAIALSAMTAIKWRVIWPYMSPLYQSNNTVINLVIRLSH